MVFRRPFRRGQSLRPINRIKHVVDVQYGEAQGAFTKTQLIKTVESPVLANVTEVEIGCTINGIYLKVEANATSSAALSNFYLIIYKNPGGNLADINPNAVGIDDNKRFVIHQEMIMFQQVTNSNPRTIFNGVIVIPRGYRRFGPNDLLTMRTTSPGTSTNVCLQCHYKEFR